ncbi:hypothetical protein C8R45DRAFT_1149227 [Mycena sanguinolenta]|nr:hypothetical protein C8R45DRAFT_1149227 [Mycena sanguinolenta]
MTQLVIGDRHRNAIRHLFTCHHGAQLSMVYFGTWLIRVEAQHVLYLKKRIATPPSQICCRCIANITRLLRSLDWHAPALRSSHLGTIFWTDQAKRNQAIIVNVERPHFTFSRCFSLSEGDHRHGSRKRTATKRSAGSEKLTVTALSARLNLALARQLDIGSLADGCLGAVRCIMVTKYALNSRKAVNESTGDVRVRLAHAVSRRVDPRRSPWDLSGPRRRSGLTARIDHGLTCFDAKQCLAECSRRLSGPRQRQSWHTRSSKSRRRLGVPPYAATEFMVAVLPVCCTRTPRSTTWIIYDSLSTHGSNPNGIQHQRCFQFRGHTIGVFDETYSDPAFRDELSSGGVVLTKRAGLLSSSFDCFSLHLLFTDGLVAFADQGLQHLRVYLAGPELLTPTQFRKGKAWTGVDEKLPAVRKTATTTEIEITNTLVSFIIFWCTGILRPRHFLEASHRDVNVKSLMSVINSIISATPYSSDLSNSLKPPIETSITHI